MSQFNFDYSRTMMMKMGIALPDNKGGCIVYNTFEQALEKIKIVDSLTLGAPKIIYLVGWQYLGHDDKYPAFFEVNEYAKREQDKTARDSLLWLVNEAKKYNTVVSLHINLSDAYPDSPLWDEYLEKDLILKGIGGKPKVTGTWNDRKAYQVRFKAEYESGYFQKRVDKLLELFPLREAGTVHVDAFFVRKGKHTSITEEKKYRRKMIEYFMDRGIDVTSEFIYRERKNGLRLHFGKSDVVGLIPAFWNLVMTQKDYIKYSPKILAGGRLNMDLQHDKDLEYLFYGNTHGEDCFKERVDWQQKFLEKFALGSVPYLFLNQFELQKITGRGKNRVAHFSGGVETSIKDKKIVQNNHVLKNGETLCIPLAWKQDCWFAWSKKRGKKNVYVPFEKAVVSKVTSKGLVECGSFQVKNGMLTLDFAENEAYMIKEMK